MTTSEEVQSYFSKTQEQKEMFEYLTVAGFDECNGDKRISLILELSSRREISSACAARILDESLQSLKEKMPTLWQLEDSEINPFKDFCMLIGLPMSNRVAQEFFNWRMYSSMLDIVREARAKHKAEKDSFNSESFLFDSKNF